ncbi:HD domain-containing protein [Parapedobacter sp. ISTM3]|uniref:HD domain-containing protein n=1 Tax=Parapedobacter sp. ISTM3 TaxID=2800130 RepID=UPI0019080637|nr:HD domain-containing protein [Parapedobacter sp. ISTM3]MBK1442010.1 HD domain-containing protein [Parapedobacter sp. ISTM3]
MNAIIDAVLAFATNAHEGQTRKYTPEPYISHPIRVMERCKLHTDRAAIHAAALLHDVLEDTAVDAAQLSRFLHGLMPESMARETMTYVVELTDVYIKKDYPQFNRKTRKQLELDRLANISPNAQTIKYADIIDNASEIAVHDPDFARVLLSEYRQVLKRLVEGDSALYRQAVKAASSLS